jgi:hypothetical protein
MIDEEYGKVQRERDGDVHRRYLDNLNVHNISRLLTCLLWSLLHSSPIHSSTLKEIKNNVIEF